MNKYFDLLNRVKSYEELRKLIIRVKSEIKVLKRNRDSQKLFELKNFLVDLQVISFYVLKKKYKEMRNTIIVDETKKLQNKGKDCLELYRMLDKLYILGLKEESYASNLPDMNSWLKNIFNLYDERGYIVTLNDFKKIFSVKLADNKKNNYIIEKYMELFFKNDPESPEFSQLLFELSEKFDIELGDHNPVFSIVSSAIKILNNRHSGLFMNDFNKMNEITVKLGFDSVNIDNIYSYRNTIYQQMELIKGSLEQIDNGDYTSILSSYLDNLLDESKVDIDLAIVEFCNFITNGKYNLMDASEKDRFFVDLPKIIDIIIKSRIYNYMDRGYEEYEKSGNFDGLNYEDSLVSQKIRELKLEICELNIQKESFLNMRGISKVINKKKSQDISSKLLLLEGELLNLENQLILISDKKKEYVSGIYSMYNMDAIKLMYDDVNIDNSDKLFGVFDFDMLPLDNIKINNMEIFKRYGIVIPEFNSREFIDISNRCLKFISNNKFKERFDSAKRILTGADDKRLSLIVSGKYDYLIESVNVSHLMR